MRLPSTPARLLRREPGLSLALIATIAIGIGVSTALFVYLSAFVVPMIPSRDPARLFQVHFGTADDRLAASSLNEVRAVEASSLFADVAVNTPSGATVSTGGESRFAWGQAVTPGFFSTFAARAEVGRLFVAGDETVSGPPPVVLSHRLWRDLLRSDPAAIGRALTLNGATFTVVGVTERSFQGVGYASEWFVPLSDVKLLSATSRYDNPAAKFLFLWGLVHPGSDGMSRAEAGLAGLARGLDASDPLSGGATRVPALEPATLFGSSYEDDPYYRAARILIVAAALLLLLGASNLSGLLLARATARDHEWAVRKALGAGPGWLIASTLAELLPPLLIGLAAALGVATWTLRWIERMIVVGAGSVGPAWNVENLDFLHFDARAAIFAGAATLVTIAIATTAPLLRALRRSPSRVLQAGAARSGVDRSALAPRRLLVTVQIALSVVLVVGGALLARTLQAYASSDPGFESGDLALAAIYLPPTASAPEVSADFYRRLLVRTREIPGVADAGLASVGPNSGMSRQTRLSLPEAPGHQLETDYNLVAPGYLRMLGVSLLAGRDLDDRDRPGAAPAAVVSRSLAERLWGNPEQAVGRTLRLDLPALPGQAGPEFEVVGVSSDAGISRPSERQRPWILLAYGQRTFARMQLVVRTALPLAALEPRLRQAVGATRADASIIDLVPAPEQLRRALQGPRMNAQVAGGLALFGLATALLGLVALQIFTVRLRRRDLAVRMALGASRVRISREVLAETLRLTLGGVAAGLVVALAVARLLRSLLFGVGTTDPASFAGTLLLLLATALAAAWLPARRAARVDPAENLRAL